MPSSKFETRLNYVLQARDEKFKTVLDSAVRRMERMDRAAKKSSQGIRGLGNSLAKLAQTFRLTVPINSLGGFFSFASLNKSLQATDLLAKSVRNLGVSANQLQAWTQAAREAGIAQEKFQVGIKRFARSIGDALVLGGEITKIYDRLGVSVVDANGKIRDTANVFYDVADAIRNLGTAEQISVLGQLFGRGSVDFRNFISQGASPIRAFEQDFGSNRRSIDPDTLRIAEKLQNEQDAIFGELSNQFNRFAVRLLNASGATEAFATAIRDVSGLFRWIADQLGTATPGQRGPNTTREQREGLNIGTGGPVFPRQSLMPLPPPAMAALQARLAAEAGGASGSRSARPPTPSIAAQAARFEAEAAAREKEERLVEKRKEAAERLKMLRERTAETEERAMANMIARQHREEDRRLEAIARENAERIKGIEAAARREGEAADARRAARADTEDALLQRIRPEFRPTDTSGLVESGRLTTEEAAAFRQTEYTAYLRQLAQSQTAVGRLASGLQHFGSMIPGILSGVQSIGDAFQATIQRIIAQVLQASVIDPLVGGITSLFTGTPAAALAGGGLSPGALGGALPRAGGGPVRTGERYLVGERGPELFVPGASGAIVPAGATAAAMGGGAVSITINVESTDGPGVRAAIAEAQPQLTEAAIRAVAVRQSRPGSVLGRQLRSGRR